MQGCCHSVHAQDAIPIVVIACVCTKDPDNGAFSQQAQLAKRPRWQLVSVACMSSSSPVLSIPIHPAVLPGTSLQSPLLAQLTSLQRLTRVHLGGCGISDNDITRHLDAFSALQDLDLWGCTAGDESARHISHTLQGLERLSMAWSKLSSALPLLPSLTYLDLSHCRLCGGCADQDFVAASGMQQLEVVVLVQTEVDEMGCELLEGLLR